MYNSCIPPPSAEGLFHFEIWVGQWTGMEGFMGGKGGGIFIYGMA